MFPFHNDYISSTILIGDYEQNYGIIIFMQANEHYEKATTTEPAMVRGSDLLIREILNRTTEATLAVALEQRLENLIALLSVPAFSDDFVDIEKEIRRITGLSYENPVGIVSTETNPEASEEEAPVPDSAYGVIEFKKPFI